jgi:hypothetical protein
VQFLDVPITAHLDRRSADAMKLPRLRFPLRARVATPSRDLLDRMYGRVFGFAYQVLGDAELAARAVESVFLQCPVPETDREVWSKLLTTLRSYVARGFVVRPLVPTSYGWQAELLSGLARLDPLDRALLLLRYHEGLELDELAEVVGVSPDELRRQLVRVRAHLLDQISAI